MPQKSKKSLTHMNLSNIVNLKKYSVQNYGQSIIRPYFYTKESPYISFSYTRSVTCTILPFHDPSGIRNEPLRTRSLESVELLPAKNSRFTES